MKIAPLMCAIWMCTPLALAVRAADNDAPERPAAARGAGDASGQAAPAARPQALEPARKGPPKDAVSKGGNAGAALAPGHGSVAPQSGPAAPPGEAGQPARSNADRLRSLLRTQARARGAQPPRRPAAGSRRAGATGTAIAASQGASRAKPTAAYSKITARAPLGANPPGAEVLTRGSSIGGPHPAGAGRLGGAAFGGAAFGRAAPGRAAPGRAAPGRAATATRAALDGAQMRRRF